MTFDNRLFLWKYDEKDFNVWDGLDQIIVSVGLVRPKPGIFVETIRYLLVLTTPVEIVVLGVSFAGDSLDGEMILQPTALSVPSDEVNMLSIVGTPSGRIFMCGNDGNLYELDYQSPGGWFSKKCRKRNHTQSVLGSYLPFLSRLFTTDPITELRFDSTRNILYALTSSSTIHGYWLGADGKSLAQFASRSNLENDPNVKARIYGPAGSELKIVSIFPVSASESNRIHLIAICSSGVRLYFTTSPSYSEKPYALQVLHVDHPLRDMRNRSCKVQTAFFSYGCLIMAAELHPDTDQTLFGLHFDMMSKEQGNSADEPAASLRLSGTTWAIAEAALPAFVHISPDLIPPPNVANELATQHFVPARKFLCLTNNGLYTIERRRPLDQLIAILGRSQGNVEASEELKMFFSFFGEAEACAMCLVIATCYVLPGSSFHRGVTAQIRDYAASAFLFLGGHTPDRAVAYFGQQTQFSDRYNGFGLYLARLLQPVWQLPINRITAYTPEELRLIRDNLSNLLAFVEQTRFAPLPQAAAVAASQSQHQSGAGVGGQFYQQPQQAAHSRLVVRVIDNLRGRAPNYLEQTNLSNLVMLLLRASEALTMLILLNEFDVTIIDSISTDRALTACLFSEFVSTQTGVTVTNLIIAFLIKVGASEQQQTDEICRQLSLQCPLFFNQNDREHFSAVKKLREAALLPSDNPTREEMLGESLSIFRRVAADLSFSDVFAAIDEMRVLGFYTGMVEVAMLAAQSREKQRPNNQDDRFRCFDVIVQTLSFLREDAKESSRALYRRLKKLVLREGNDECLQYVFSWYLQQNLHAELLDVESKLLETFLRTNDLTFLAEYYTANHRFGEAAATYVDLAEVQAAGLDLTQRIVFLGHAMANVKQADGHGANLPETEVRVLMEKAEVAQIQLRILHDLQSRHRPAMGAAAADLAADTTTSGAQNLSLNASSMVGDVSMSTLHSDVERLNSRLFSISDLYNQFAWPYQLWETCLIIMYTANHECPRNLVDKIWNNILNQERRQMRGQTFAAVTSSLSRKVELVAKSTSLSLKVFPIETVCELLEQVSFEMKGREGFNGTWVVQLLGACGVSLNTLFDLYHHFLVSTDDRSKHLHFSLPLRFVVESWIEAVTFLPPTSAEHVQFRTKRLPFLVDEIILRLEECPEAKQEISRWQGLKNGLKQ